jgi:hypothetical protein
MSDSLMPRTVPLAHDIPFLAGRPDRSHRIDQDDLVNLKIALGLHRDVRDLCDDPHLFAGSSGG